MKGLSPRQKQVLEILENAAREGEHLSVREIGDLIGVSSTCTVHQHLKALERKGYLKPSNRKHRSLQLAAPPRPLRHVRVAGDAYAGPAVGEPQTLNDSITLPAEWASDDGISLYRVRGNGLAELAIRDGDLVVVLPHQEAKTGDVVVTMVNDTYELRRVVTDEGCLHLDSGDGGLMPVASENGFTLIGRVSLVIRRL